MILWNKIKIIHKIIDKSLDMLNIIHIFVSTKGVKNMAKTRKYHIGCSGSGWGIWNNDGKKVMSCFSHYHAVEALYNLMGWNWNPSKYRG